MVDSFPPATFTTVVDAIRNLSEASRPLLDRFSRGRREAIAALAWISQTREVHRG